MTIEKNSDYSGVFYAYCYSGVDKAAGKFKTMIQHPKVDGEYRSRMTRWNGENKSSSFLNISSPESLQNGVRVKVDPSGGSLEIINKQEAVFFVWESTGYDVTFCDVNHVVFSSSKTKK